MGWLNDAWGVKAALTAGRLVQDKVREILQHLSQDVPEHRVFSHLGWRRIADNWVYLHAGGALGLEGIRVQPPVDLALYRFPKDPREPGKAYQALLRALDVAPHRLTLPLFGAIHIAAFSSIVQPDFVLFLDGPTGSLKSTLTALFLSAFGEFARKGLPNTWLSTAYQLLDLTFWAKDVLLVVDDYSPSTSHREASRLEEKAHTFIRAIGNRSGRGRLAPDGTPKPQRRPRAMVASSGEHLPPGQSVQARLFILPVEPDSVDRVRLKACQGETDLYPHALSAYLLDIAPHYDDLVRSLPNEVIELRTKAQDSELHSRLPEAIAVLFLGCRMGIEAAKRFGALTSSQAASLEAEAWAVLVEVAKEQGRVVQEENPVNRFFTILSELLRGGRMYLEGHATRQPENPQTWGWERDLDGADLYQPKHGAERVGWVDRDALYLLPETTYRFVVEHCQRSGSYFPLSARALPRQLASLGFLDVGENKNSKVLMFHSTYHRVWVVSRDRLREKFLL